MLLLQSWRRPSDGSPDNSQLPPTATESLPSVTVETKCNAAQVKVTAPMKDAELELVKNRLLALEKNIERRYFQPPFAKR